MEVLITPFLRVSSCSEALYQAARQRIRNSNVLKPTGTGSSRGPHLRWSLGAQMFSSDRYVRVEHFFGVPAESIFGGVKSRPHLFRSYTRTHATPARRVRRAQANLQCLRPLTWEYCSPSNPGTPQNCLRRFCGEPHSGIPPPLVKSVDLYHGSIVTPFLRVSPEIVPP